VRSTETRTYQPSRFSKRENEDRSYQPVGPLNDEDDSVTRSRGHDNRKHQLFVFPDPVAFRYLREDSAISMVENRRDLAGYQLYVVEQWACSRTHPIFVIATYTGDPTHVIKVGVLRLPLNEASWSPRLSAYFGAVSDFHARRMQTPAGTILVTNLSSFPSALTVVHVPDGDIRKNREIFRCNEDLKRLGCSGRAGLALTTPTDATHAKFSQLFRVSDRIEFQQGVLELVRFCQLALVAFGKLQVEYADGLLCDVTERAVNDWWSDIGADIYGVEPDDGILGPTTVSALLGLLMGARMRLHELDYQVPKDCLDLKGLEVGISQFQKSSKIDRSRKLDRVTLDRLHKASAKAVSTDGWKVSRGLKSTVADLGGKGGEMVVEMVGRQKASISSIETTDLATFTKNVKGESLKWLWLGKPRKNVGDDADLYDGSPAFFALHRQFTDEGGYSAPGRSLTKESGRSSTMETTDSRRPSLSSEAALDREPQLRKAVLKTVSDKFNDARLGFGWIKDVVGIPSLRGHRTRETPEGFVSSSDPGLPLTKQLSRAKNRLRKDAPDENTPLRKSLEYENERTSLDILRALPDSSPASSQKLDDLSRVSTREDYSPRRLHASPKVRDSRPVTPERAEISSLHGSAQDAENPAELLQPALLRHRASYSQIETRPLNSARWPRRVSFSAAEDALFISPRLKSVLGTATVGDPEIDDALRLERFQTLLKRLLWMEIADTHTSLAVWVDRTIHQTQLLEKDLRTSGTSLSESYFQALNEWQMLQQNSDTHLASERDVLEDAVHEVEALSAKLEYEIGSLRSRVQDVDYGLKWFIAEVDALEQRAAALAPANSKLGEGWLRWAIRFFLGFGDAPTHSTG
jgi:hypothetical protein